MDAGCPGVLMLALASFASLGYLLNGPVARPAAVAHAGAARSSGLRMEELVISAKTVKSLRDVTGAGMMDCKKALKDANGDVEAATEWLRAKGMATAAKKASRAAKEGIIDTYIHTGAKLGVMVEVNCETDFVAKNPDFKELARNIAMQIAACPTVEVVKAEDIPPEWVEQEKRIEAASEDLQGKPEAVIEKIVTGRVEKQMKAKLLMVQPYIRDPSMTVDDLVTTNVQKLGENIKVARFVRFNVGGGVVEADDEE